MDAPQPNPSPASGSTQHVELILRRLDSLPTLSPIATRILQLGSDDKAEIAEVASLIESDPALTVRILGLCRKAERGLGGRITTVRRAVVMLGLEAVQSAVLGVAVFELLDRESEIQERTAEALGHNKGAYEFDRRGFWQHAIGVACAAELIAERHPDAGVAPEEAFTGGLLHGLGRLVLQLVLPQAYRRVVEACERRQSAAAPVERSIIGMDNHLAGKRVCEHWGLPTPIADTIWLHSQPAASLPSVAHKDLILLVTAARVVCRQLHLGWSGDCDTPPSMETVFIEAGLDPNRIRRLVPKLHEAVASRCNVLGLDRSESPDLLIQSVSNANKRLSRANRALEDRVRTTAGLHRCLVAIREFHQHTGAPRSTAEAQAGIGLSARAVLGDGYIALLGLEADAWHLIEIGPDGDPGAPLADQPPADYADRVALSDLAHNPAAAGAVASWVLAHADNRVKTRGLRAVALGDADMPSALLLFENRNTIAEILGDGLETLRAAWGASWLAGQRQDEVRVLGEQLAEASRRLGEAQERLTEAESLARLGEMTAGAAHEMNNPLAVISGRAQLLALRLADTAEGSSAKAIVGATRDLSELITSLHVLADPPEPKLRPCTIGDVADRALQIARDRLDRDVPLAINAQDARHQLVADPDLLGQALGEVICNAAESAAPDQERPTISLRAQTDAVDGRLVLSVIDTGPGLSPRALRHAFDPFFSEKPAGRQRGLGLPRARRLVQQMGGQITIEPAGPVGTEARITLASPARRAQAA